MTENGVVNQLLGQAQMADAFAKFSKTVFISKLTFVKENKLYRALSGKKSENGIQFSGTWEEFRTVRENAKRVCCFPVTRNYLREWDCRRRRYSFVETWCGSKKFLAEPTFATSPQSRINARFENCSAASANLCVIADVGN